MSCLFVWNIQYLRHVNSFSFILSFFFVWIRPKCYIGRVYIKKKYIIHVYIIVQIGHDVGGNFNIHIWAASSEFGTYRLCEQRRFRRACASAQSRQNLRCSLIQAVSQEEPSDRKPDPWPLWMAAHAQLKFVITECSNTQIRLTGLIWACSGDLIIRNTWTVNFVPM